MKTITKLDTVLTPDGCEMQLFQHDKDFLIKVKGEDLMTSRMHESELELARLGCFPITERKAPRVLVGGLGLGYTLRKTLDMLGKDAEILVSELLEAVVKWNHDYIGVLNNHPLKDKRVDLRIGDIVDLIANSENKFDAILLDIDNGPDAIAYSGNKQLYSKKGIMACHRALKKDGYLAIWSAEESKKFEHILLGCKLNTRRYKAAAYKGSKRKTITIWLASENRKTFPPGEESSRNIGSW